MLLEIIVGIVVVAVLSSVVTWWGARGWQKRLEHRLDRREVERDQLADHLRAFGGDAQVLLAILGRPAPSPIVMLDTAEESYLEQSGWRRHVSGGWCPPWDMAQPWSKAKALERQRRGDSIPPQVLQGGVGAEA